MTTHAREFWHGKSDAEPLKVVVPVAGVCNADIGRLSMAGLGYRRLRHSLLAENIPVTHPITPEKFGLSFGLHGTIDSVYERFQNQVDAAMEPYGHMARPVFLAHSFGGLLALRDHALRGSAGIITAGTPHGPMPCLPLSHLVPERAKNYMPYPRWCRQATRFSEETFDMLRSNDRNQEIIFMASTRDGVISPSISLPTLPGARRVLLGTEAEAPAEFSDTEYIRSSKVGHNALISHPAATDFILTSMVKIIDPLALEPIPDNVVYGNFPQVQPAF